MIKHRPVQGMPGEFRLWQQQVRRALQGLRRLGRACLPASGYPLPTFQEAMRVLYGDSQFTAFVASRAWQQAGLCTQVEQALLHLQLQLDAFEEPDVDSQLSLDPAWQAILAQVVVVTMLLL